MNHYKVNLYCVPVFPDSLYDAETESISCNLIKIKCEDLKENKIGSAVEIKILLSAWSCTVRLQGIVKQHKGNTLMLKVTPNETWREYLKKVPVLLEDRLI